MSAPLYATAAGKCLLAGLQAGQMDELLGSLPFERLTSATHCDREMLIEEIQTVRDCGYAFNDGELQEGESYVAVPVQDDHGRIVASITLGAPSVRLADATRRRHVVQQLLAAANRLRARATHA